MGIEERMKREIKEYYLVRGAEYFKDSFLNPELTLRKRANFLLMVVQYILKNKKLLNYPIKLVIDPATVCNLRCKLCPTGQNLPGRTKTKMDFKLYKKILDEVGPYLIDISLYNWGEPFLNKDIFRMIRYAKKYKIRVLISSNLNYFNEKICREIVDSGIDKLIISLDGTSQKSVSKYQQGMDFGKTIENMKKLVGYKKKKNSKKPFIQWRFLVNKYNESEVEKAKKLAKEIGVDKLELGVFRCDMAREIFLDNEQQYENVKDWLPENESLSMYNYGKKEKKRKKKACRYLWTEATINPDGKVSPCCSVYDEKFDFGDISKKPFKEIWNNKSYTDSRKAIRGGKIENKKLICYICKMNDAVTW